MGWAAGSFTNMKRKKRAPEGKERYTGPGLTEQRLPADPLELFDRWYREEQAASSLPEPDAMVLATVDESGRPDARLVLLKGYGRRGFVFFTNYESTKAAQLDTTPFAALVFYWPERARQVRIRGTVEKVSEPECDEYFATRPEGSQLSAWVSPQSQAIHDRAVLERRLQELRVKFAGSAIPRPPFWGGYRVVPSRVEFWLGRPDRLHDRICYWRQDSVWRMARLAP